VNLGYRDVDALIDVLVNARSYGEAWASYPVLKRYQMRRMADNFIMQSGMDLFYAGFSNNLPPLRFVRNLGLMAGERAGGVERQGCWRVETSGAEICVRVVALQHCRMRANRRSDKTCQHRIRH